jgi:hypothetical protein
MQNAHDPRHINLLFESLLTIYLSTDITRTHSHTMSSSQKISISPSELPKFDGTRYRVWVDKISPLFSIMGVLDLLTRRIVAPPTAFTRPVIPVGLSTTTAGVTTVAAPTSDQWSLYNAQLEQFKDQDRQQKDFDDRAQRALGYLNICLSFGIWERIKGMSAPDAWDHLRTTYAARQFVEIMEDFGLLTSFRLDLSDPVPQVEQFMLYYSRLPTETPAATTAALAPLPIPIVSISIACMLLIKALPISKDPTHEGVYQRMIEEYHTSHPVHMMTFDSLFNAIRTTWASRFGSLSQKDRPSKGDFYIQKKSQTKKALVTVNKTSAMCSTA